MLIMGAVAYGIGRAEEGRRDVAMRRMGAREELKLHWIPLHFISGKRLRPRGRLSSHHREVAQRLN